MFIDVGTRTQINTTDAVEEINLGLIKGLAGTLFAAYISLPTAPGTNGSESPTSIILRALDAAGAPTGAEISLAIPAVSAPGNILDGFGIIGLSDGTFGLAMLEEAPTTNLIRYQQYSAAGAAIGSTVTLASGANLNVSGFSADPTGGFHLAMSGAAFEVREFSNTGVQTLVTTFTNQVDEIEATSTGGTVVTGTHSSGPTNPGTPRFYVDFPGGNPAIDYFYPSLSSQYFTEVIGNTVILQSDTVAFVALELGAFNYSAGIPAPGFGRAIQIVRFTDGQANPSLFTTLFRPAGDSESPPTLQDFIRLADGSFALAIATQYSPPAYPTLELIHLDSGGGVIGTYEMLNAGGGGGGGVQLAQLANGNVIATYSGTTPATGTDLEVFVETFSITAASVAPTAGADTLIGTSAGETIDGLAGDDVINGGAGDDMVLGNDGDDVLRGQAGADTINGGSGDDWAAYDRDANAGGNAGVTVNLGTGTATDGFGNADVLLSIERVRGTAQVDTLTGSNTTSVTEMFQGLGGADIINGAGGFDEVRYDRDFNAGGRNGVTVNLLTNTAIDGFGATDTLSNIEAARGTNLTDIFVGNGSNNEFRGLGGADTFTGGGGSDTLRYDSDADNGGVFGITVNYTSGSNGTVVDGFGNIDTFTGFNTIRGTLNVDTFNGGTNNDNFYGLAGNDIINGGAGEDFAYYDRDRFYLGGTSGVVVNLSADAVNFGGLVAAGTARDGFGHTDTLISIEDVRGTDQADVFIGGTGLSFFEGLAGGDTYITNVVQYADNYYPFGFGWVNYQNDGGAAGVTANLQTGTGTDSHGATESYTGITSIRGTGLVDTFTGNQFYNQFQGLNGADIINGGGGYDRVDYSRDAGAGGTAGVTVNLTTGMATDGFGATDTLSNIEQVIGTSNIDNITGNAWDNFLSGGNGADTLIGRDGIDNLRPGQGIDIVDGSVGTNADQGHDDRDQVDYQDLTADANGLGVIVNFSTASITHETFTVLGNTARDTGGSTDTLIDIERVRGTAGRDYFRGSDTANLREEIFRGLAGNDLIDGGAGYNVVRYQGDTADYGGTGAGGTSGAIVNLSTSSITVGAHTVLAGTARDAFGATDTLINIQGVRGTGLADHVVGGAGYDFFRSYGGADFFDGGAGTRDAITFYMDEVFFGITGVGFTIDMVAGTALNFYDNTTTTFVNVEEVSGSERNDTITGNNDINRLNGDHGNDLINGGGGNDFLTGGTGNNTFDGGADFDYVSYFYDPGLGLYNNLQRPDSFPTPWGGVTANLTTGIATNFAGGTDTLVLGTIEGLTGTIFDDSLTGDGFDNIFYGLSGSDLIDGAGGNDTVSYANWGNTLGIGVPDLNGVNASRPNGVTVALVAVGAGSANDSEGGTDTLISIENVTGSTGNDMITGSIVDNVLKGGLGNDILDGGTGNDAMDGGDGDDTIHYDVFDVAAGVTGGAGYDTLRVTNAGAPTNFDLLAQGFELAIVTNTDVAGNQPWSTQIAIYNSTWQLLTRDTTNDNLDTISEVFFNGLLSTATNRDLGTNDQPYISYTTSFNAAGAVTSVAGTYDDNTSWGTLNDVAGTEAWSSLTTTYAAPVGNAAGLATQQTGTYDNGDNWVYSYSANGNISNFIYYDVGGIPDAFNNYTISYNALGQQISVVGLNDDNGSYTTTLDTTNQVWASITTNFNATSQALYANTTYDNGDNSVANYINGVLDSSTVYDTGADDQFYQYYTSNYNAAGVLFAVSGINNDGSSFAYLV